MNTFPPEIEQNIQQALKRGLPHGTEAHVREVAARFKGHISKLEAAIGALYVGNIFGWKVLRLAHTERTLKQFEEILGLSLRDEKYCPAETELSTRHFVFRFSKQMRDYWHVVNFKIQDPSKPSRKLIE